MKDHEHTWERRAEKDTRFVAYYQCTDLECCAWGRKQFKAGVSQAITPYAKGKLREVLRRADPTDGLRAYEYSLSSREDVPRGEVGWIAPKREV